MATVLRNLGPEYALFAASHNDLKAQLGAGTKYHLDRSEVLVLHADCTDTETAIPLLNSVLRLFRFHFADELAHVSADVDEDLDDAVEATDLDSAITLANVLQTLNDEHAGDTDVHYNEDSTNLVDEDPASDEATLVLAVNELKTLMNTHAADGPLAYSVRLTSA